MHEMFEFASMVADSYGAPETASFIREAGAQYENMVRALKAFPDRTDFATAEDYADAADNWWEELASPAISAAEIE